jgi:hypothetical protein
VLYAGIYLKIEFSGEALAFPVATFEIMNRKWRDKVHPKVFKAKPHQVLV